MSYVSEDVYRGPTKACRCCGREFVAAQVVVVAITDPDKKPSEEELVFCEGDCSPRYRTRRPVFFDEQLMYFFEAPDQLHLGSSSQT